MFNSSRGRTRPTAFSKQRMYPANCTLELAECVKNGQYLKLKDYQEKRLSACMFYKFIRHLLLHVHTSYLGLKLTLQVQNIEKTQTRAIHNI